MNWGVTTNLTHAPWMNSTVKVTLLPVKLAVWTKIKHVMAIMIAGLRQPTVMRLDVSVIGLYQCKHSLMYHWLKKNAFLARILQDFLSRSCKIMHFSARHLARILQEKTFPCKILPRRKISWKVLDNFF